MNEVHRSRESYLDDFAHLAADPGRNQTCEICCRSRAQQRYSPPPRRGAKPCQCWTCPQRSFRQDIDICRERKPLQLTWQLVVLLALIAGDAVADTGQLAVRVVDDATGELLPARLMLQTSDGKYPGDRLGATAQQWPHIEAHGLFIDGAEKFTVPEGKTSITAAHGLDYQAESRRVDVIAGETTRIELRLKQVIDMRSAGWVSGDLHIHMIHGENQRETSYQDVALTCAANGLDFVSVGQEYVGAGTLDLKGYQERCRKASSPTFTMFLGGERPKNILGHQVLLGCANPFVISEEPPYFQSAHAIHKQGGIVVYVHPIRYFPGKQYGGEWLDFPGNNLARELIFDAYAGPAFDGLSVLSDEPAHADAHQLWFNLLNRGFFVPVFADSDACFDRPMLGLKAPGFWSTYFYVGADTPVTQQALVEAVRNGRTMATTGPLLQFRIAGEISGATLPLDGKSRDVSIEAYCPQHAFSLESVDAKTRKPAGIARLELIRNGKVVMQWQPNSPAARLTHSISETEPCWYTVRAYGADDRWQVALASPIYFAEQPAPAKRDPLTTVMRGRIYDFKTGLERTGQVEVRRGGEVLRQFQTAGQFQVRMPIDAEITVSAKGERALTKNLLMDYGPIHRFLWYLESRDLGRNETLDRFEFLARTVDLEFPLGQRMSGSFVAKNLAEPTELAAIEVLKGPVTITDGTVAVAAVLTDAEQVSPGDVLHVAAIFRDEGAAAKCGPYVVEARGYDPSRPTAFGALKKFASVENTWDTATDLSDGYKLVAGKVTVPDWVEAGPAGVIDLSIRARQGHGDAAFIGLAIPLGPTKRALSLSSSWPTMPLSWPDRNYGIGPFKICNRLGKKGQPKADYRQLNLSIAAAGETLDLMPARDARGCADADDAMYADHFFDQILNEESRLAEPDPVRKQPAVKWREDLPLMDAAP